MTRRQTLNKINAELKQAKEQKDLTMAAYWQTIRAMADMRSMKTWTLEQIQEQYQKAVAEHAITVECI